MNQRFYACMFYLFPISHVSAIYITPIFVSHGWINNHSYPYHIDDSHLHITYACMFICSQYHMYEWYISLPSWYHIDESTILYMYVLSVHYHMYQSYISQRWLPSLYHIDELTILDMYVSFLPNITCINEIHYLEESLLRIK